MNREEEHRIEREKKQREGYRLLAEENSERSRAVPSRTKGVGKSTVGSVDGEY